MKLLITRQTVAQLRNVRPGDVVDVSEREARVLKGANKAIDFTGENPFTHRHTRTNRTTQRKAK